MAAGQQDRSQNCARYQRTADLGYQDHYVVDGGKERIILAMLAAPAEVPEDHPALDLLWHARFRWRLWLCQATRDKAYGTLDVIRTLEDQHIRAYIPLPESGRRTPVFAKGEFTYDSAAPECAPAGGNVPAPRPAVRARPGRPTATPG